VTDVADLRTSTRGALLDEHRRVGRRAAAAALAVLTAAGAWRVASAGDPTDQATSCAATMRFAGRSYVPMGELTRIPRPGEAIGSGRHPRCGEQDASRSAVAAVPGVDPSVAVFSQGAAWYDASRGTLPSPLAALQAPVRCEASRTFDVVGDWLAREGSIPTSDDDLTPPFVAVIRATRGAGLPLDDYAAVVVDVRVTSTTAGVDDPTLASEALRGPAPVRVTVRCAGGRFVADAIRRAGRPPA
jgi:hypothetical protein